MKILETLTNIAVLVVAIIVAAVFVHSSGVLPSSSKPRNAAEAEQMLRGKAVPLADIRTSDSPATLVLGMSTHCIYCGQNTPLYAILSHIKAEHRMAFVAVGPEPKAEIDDYFQSRNIAPDRIVSRALESFNVSVTPTLMLVDSTGSVKYAWVDVGAK
jgi:hypothetical protein